jgi:hypothetical protein
VTEPETPSDPTADPPQPRWVRTTVRIDGLVFLLTGLALVLGIVLDEQMIGWIALVALTAWRGALFLIGRASRIDMYREAASGQPAVLRHCLDVVLILLAILVFALGTGHLHR